MGLRRLRYLIYTNTKYEIKTELDGLNCQFNDIVGLVLDHNLSNITGRILGVENDVIEVDREIPAAIGELIKCWVTDVKPNNKSCSLELVNYDERVFVDDL